MTKRIYCATVVYVSMQKKMISSLCLYIVTHFLICVYLDVYNKISILNYINADIEESRYYILQEFKILPYCIPVKNINLQNASGSILTV